jgi:cytochrome bd ubiquinol oxidase subunit I
MGDRQGKAMTTLQPVKLAAFEGLWETTDKAPFSLVALIDEANEKNSLAIKIPYMLSILAANDPNATIVGLKELQEESVEKFGRGYYLPSIPLMFWTFRIMVGLGFLMLLFGVIAIVLAFRKKGFEKQKLFWIFVPAITFPYIANTAGWLMTERGRQPWVVYGQMLTQNAASPILNSRPWMVVTTLVGFIIVYSVLIVLDVYLILKYARVEPSGDDFITPKTESHSPSNEVKK